jgi:glycine cleavage system H protein
VLRASDLSDEADVKRFRVNPVVAGFDIETTIHRTTKAKNVNGVVIPMSPDHLKYSKTHEWVAVEDGVATIGITDFAVHLLTDLVFADLPPLKKRLVQGQPFGEVESVKAVSDLYAPLTGEVIAKNERLTERRGPDGKVIPAELELLSTSPFGDGWMIKVSASNLEELANLLDQAQYKAHCEATDH